MAPRAMPVSKLRARRRKRRMLAIIFLVVAVLVVVGGLIGLAWLPSLRIQTVEVSGVSSTNTAEVIQTAQADLAGTYAYVLPKNNVLVYPRDAIQKHLLEQFSTFESAAVRLKNTKTLSVSIVERKTTALWCGESPENPSPCYLLDGTGKAFAPAAEYSGELYVKYYGPASGNTARQFLTPAEFAGVSSLVAALAASEIKELPMRAEIENGEGRITFENGFEVIYKLADSAADILDRLHVAFEAEPFAKHTLAEIAYLDLRFGDKLYYHLKQ